MLILFVANFIFVIFFLFTLWAVGKYLVVKPVFARHYGCGLFTRFSLLFAALTLKGKSSEVWDPEAKGAEDYQGGHKLIIKQALLGPEATEGLYYFLRDALQICQCYYNVLHDYLLIYLSIEAWALFRRILTSKTAHHSMWPWLIEIITQLTSRFTISWNRFLSKMLIFRWSECCTGRSYDMERLCKNTGGHVEGRRTK